MSDSYGASFPSSSTNIGHTHYNTITGGIYRYMGGDISNANNWLLVDGILATDPDTASWGLAQRGASWYDKSTDQSKGWDGTQIVIKG